MQFEWKGIIRIEVGELTRANQFDYFAEVGKLDKQAEDYILQSNVLLMQYAPVKVAICENGQWRQVAEEETVEVGANVFRIAPRLTQDLYNQLPGGLAKRWFLAADQEQGYLLQNATDFFGAAVPNGD